MVFTTGHWTPVKTKLAQEKDSAPFPILLASGAGGSWEDSGRHIAGRRRSYGKAAPGLGPSKARGGPWAPFGDFNCVEKKPGGRAGSRRQCYRPGEPHDFLYGENFLSYGTGKRFHDWRFFECCCWQ